MRLTLVYVRANVFKHVQSRVKSSAAFGSRTGRCTVRKKSSFYKLVKLNTIFFSQTQSWKFKTYEC